MTTTYWAVMVAAGTFAVVVPPSDSAAGTFAALLPGLVAAGAVVLGVWRWRPPDARPWLLVAVALVLNAAGDALFALTSVVAGTPISWVDLLYVATIPCVLAAMVSLGRSESRHQSRSSAVDALTVTIALLVAAWAIVVHPLLRPVGAADQAALVVYPLFDALLIAGVVRLYTSRRRSLVVDLLAIGALGTFASDIGYATAVAAGTWHSGTVIDLGWLVFYAAWGAAALQPGMARLAEPERLSDRDAPAYRLAVLVLTSLTAPAVLLVEGLTGTVRDGVTLAIASAGIFLLNLFRVTDALNTHRRWLRYTEHHDGLTGLANRGRFASRLADAVAQGTAVGVLVLDLDEFQVLNDTLGPAVGDEILIVTGRRLARQARQLGRHDLVARLGGDEFGLLILEPADGSAELAAERLDGRAGRTDPGR